MNSLGIFLLLILFIQICYCQYIMTSYSKNKMIEHLLKLYKYIFFNYAFDYLYNTDFDDIKTNDIEIKEIQLSNFNFTDQDYIPYYLIEKNVIVFSEHKVGMTFKYKTNKNNETFSFFYFNPKSIVLKENKTFKTEFYMDIEIDKKDCIYDSRDADMILEIIKQNFLNKNMKKLKSAFHNAMKKGINELYLRYESIRFSMNDIFGSETISHFIELSRFSGSCDSIHNKDTVQCYYIGGGYEAYNNVNFNKEIVGSDFFNDNSKYKLFISHKIFNKFLDKIKSLSKTTLFNNTEIVKNFSNNFNNYFSENNTIKNIYFLYQNLELNFNSTIVKSTFEFFIETTSSKNYTMNITFKGNFSTSYFVTNLNLVSKDLKVDNINSETLKIKSHDKLKSDINSYLENKEFYFADKNGIELYDFFKLIQNTTIVNGGIIIEGPALLKSIQDIFE